MKQPVLPSIHGMFGAAPDDFDDSDETKRQYAYYYLCLRHNPNEAANRVASNAQSCLIINATWPYDPVVRAEIDRLLSTHGADHFRMSREEFADEVLATAYSVQSPKDKIELMKLYADVRGFIKKGGDVNNLSVINAGGVMQVTSYGSDSNWEQATAEQQRQLQAAAEADLRAIEAEAVDVTQSST